MKNITTREQEKHSDWLISIAILSTFLSLYCLVCNIFNMQVYYSYGTFIFAGVGVLATIVSAKIRLFLPKKHKKDKKEMYRAFIYVLYTTGLMLALIESEI